MAEFVEFEFVEFGEFAEKVSCSLYLVTYFPSLPSIARCARGLLRIYVLKNMRRSLLKDKVG